ncbi:LURP-one-related, partial [Dillenia turbinata]
LLWESDPKDLLFSGNKASLIQFKTELDVCLASDSKEEVCDFKAKGSWLERACTIYAGNSSTVIAQTHRKHKQCSKHCAWERQFCGDCPSTRGYGLCLYGRFCCDSGGGQREQRRLKLE